MISVVIPTFNRANLISRAINSVLAQTYPVFEILVCDDGSTDDTEKVVSLINDDRVKFIKCKHSGKPAVPRNVAISLAKGNWIAFLDSDDEWLPHKLETQMNLIKKLRIKAICSNAFRVDSSSETRGSYLQNMRNKIIDFEELLNDNVIICSSVLVEKNIFDSCGLFNEKDDFRAIEDYLLWLKISMNNKWYYINESLLKYNDDFENSIRSTDFRRFEEQRSIIFNELLNLENTDKKKYSNVLLEKLNFKKREKISFYIRIRNFLSRIKSRF